jgi:large subunit ribosomal protein L30
MSLKLRITQVRSSAHRRYDQALTLRALGFRRLQQTIEHNDTPQIRGMVNKIIHLLKVEEIQG